MIRRPLIALATATTLATLAISCKPAADAPPTPVAPEPAQVDDSTPPPTPETPETPEVPEPTPSTEPTEPTPAEPTEPAPTEPAPAEPAEPTPTTEAPATSDDPLIQQGIQLLDKTVTQIAAICTALENVTDEASAEAAAKAITDASADLQQLSTDGKALSETLSDEQNAQMEVIANGMMGTLMERMGNAIESIAQNPDAAPALDALEAFNRAVSGVE